MLSTTRSTSSIAIVEFTAPISAAGRIDEQPFPVEPHRQNFEGRLVGRNTSIGIKRVSIGPEQEAETDDDADRRDQIKPSIVQEKSRFGLNALCLLDSR
jgi:hypothetical protein